MDMKPALPKEKSRVKPVSTDMPSTAMMLTHMSTMTPWTELLMPKKPQKALLMLLKS